jgi:hypothetical protein
LRETVRQQLAAVQIGPDTFNDVVADIAPRQIAGDLPAAMMLMTLSRNSRLNRKFIPSIAGVTCQLRMVAKRLAIMRFHSQPATRSFAMAYADRTQQDYVRLAKAKRRTGKTLAA